MHRLRSTGGIEIISRSENGFEAIVANLLLSRAVGDLVQNVTHKELAERLHVYRESATTALGELKKAGIIGIGRKEIRIIHRARLERAARE